METNIALSIKDLVKTYANGTEALKKISFSIKKGEFFALLGPNGAGKSTTIGILCGLVEKSSGHVEINGQSFDTHGPSVRKLVGVVPQEFNFGIFEKVYDIVLNQAGYYGITRRDAKPSVDKYLKALGLWEKRDEPARTLSGGMKRRLMIARALVHEPKLLILDEPTAGVDVELRRGMWDFLRDLNKKGVTIILTTHYLEEAELLCEKMAIIDKGKIIKYGPIKELLSSMKDEVYTIDLDRNIEKTLEKSLEAYGVEENDRSIDVIVSPAASLDEAIRILQKGGYQVLGIRSKTNRLEQFFLANTKK